MTSRQRVDLTKLSLIRSESNGPLLTGSPCSSRFAIALYLVFGDTTRDWPPLDATAR